MRKFFGPKGSVSRFTIHSRALESNMLGDPSERVVDVYVPAGHDGHGLPLLVDLVGFTGSGLSHTNWVGFRENLPERLDRLIGEQRLSPVVVAFPDCFTRLGGNQYINSASMGAWEDFLLQEMLPAIEERFDCGGAGRRGVFGKSSGGYGAIAHALRHSDVWWPRPAFRRYGLRAMLSARHAGGVARTRRRRELDRALVAAPRQRKRPGGFVQGDQRVGDGGQLRSRSDPVLGLRLPVRSTPARSSRSAGRTGCGKIRSSRSNPGRQSAPAEGALYRLRRTISSICSTVPAGSCGG